MTARLVKDAEHWRRRAAEMRALLPHMEDEADRVILLQVIAEYEELARRAGEGVEPGDEFTSVPGNELTGTPMVVPREK